MIQKSPQNFFKTQSLQSNDQHQYSQSVDNTFEKSIIRVLPESVDINERLNQKNLQIEKLTHALDFYKSQQSGSNKVLEGSSQVQDKSQNIDLAKYLYTRKIKDLISKSSESQALASENERLRQEIKDLTSELSELRENNASKSMMIQPFESINLAAEGENLFQETNRPSLKRPSEIQKENAQLKEEIVALERKLSQSDFENQITRQVFDSLIEIKVQDTESKQSLKEQLDQICLSARKQLKASGSMSKSAQSFSQELDDLKRKLNAKSLQNEELRRQNKALAAKVQQRVTQGKNGERSLIAGSNLEFSQLQTPSKAKGGKDIRSSFSSERRHLHQNQGASISAEMDTIDLERLQLKISERNKEYEELFLRFQQLESEKLGLEDLNQELERERKFLEARLGEIQILQEGDEVAGEMENKLVLMSTELMRMGHISRSRTQENKELQVKVKELIHRIEVHERDAIEQQKILLNYKEQLLLIERKVEEKRSFEAEDEELLARYKEQVLELEAEKKRDRFLLREGEENYHTLELKYRVYVEKVERLQSENRELEREANNVGKSQALQQNNRIFDLEVEVQSYKHSNKSYEEEVKALHSKVSSLRTQLHNSETEASALLGEKKKLEEKIYHFKEGEKEFELAVERERNELKKLRHEFEETMISKNQQIRKYTDKATLLERQTQTLIRSPGKKYTANEQQMLDNFHGVESENIELKISVSKYEEKMALLTQEIERLHFQINKVSEESSEISTLRETNRNQEKQLRDLRKSKEATSNKCLRLQGEVKIYEEKLYERTAEIQILQKFEGQSRRAGHEAQLLRDQLQMKEEQYEKLKTEIRTLEADARKSSSASKQADISSLKRGLELEISEKYEKKISAMDIEIGELSQKVKLYKKKEERSQSSEELEQQLSSEIIRLNGVLAESSQEAIKLQKQIDLYEHKLKTCQKMLHEQSLQFKEEIEWLQSRNQATSPTAGEIESQTQAYEKEILTLVGRLELFKEENNKLQEKVDQLTAENVRFEHRVSELEYHSKEKSLIGRENESYLQTVIGEIKVSNERLETSMKQIEVHYIERLESKEQEFKELQKEFSRKNEQLKDQNSVLASQVKRMEEQTQTISQKDHQDATLQREQFEQTKRIKGEYQMKLALLSQEVERCNQIIEQKSQTAQILRERVSVLEQERNSFHLENNSSQNTIDLLSKQIVRLSQVLAENIEAIRELQRENGKLEKENQLLEQNIKSLRQAPAPGHQQNTQKDVYEVEKLTDQLERARKETEFEKQKYYEMVKRTNYLEHEHREMSKDISERNRELIQAQEESKRLSFEKQSLQQQARKKQSENQSLRKGEQRLKSELSEEAQRCKSLREEISAKENLIENLSKGALSQQTSHKSQEIEKIVQEMAIMKESNQALQANLELILSENKKLVAQVESFKRSKSNSLTEDARRNSAEQLFTVQASEQSHEVISKLKEELFGLKKEKQQTQRQVEALEARIIENDRLRQQEERIRQNDIANYDQKIKSMAREKKSLQQELFRVEREYREKVEDKHGLEKQCSELEFKVQSLGHKLDLTKRDYEEKRQHNADEYTKLLGKYNLLAEEKGEAEERHKLEVLRWKEKLKKSIEKDSEQQPKEKHSPRNTRGHSSEQSEYYHQQNGKHAVYYTNHKMSVIEEVDERQERSRTPSTHQPNPSFTSAEIEAHKNEFANKELLQKFQLMEVVNKKLKAELECYRNKNIEYEFKMNKLKEEFQLISRLIDDYKRENERLRKLNSGQNPSKPPSFSSKKLDWKHTNQTEGPVATISTTRATKKPASSQQDGQKSPGQGKPQSTPLLIYEQNYQSLKESMSQQRIIMENIRDENSGSTNRDGNHSAQRKGTQAESMKSNSGNGSLQNVRQNRDRATLQFAENSCLVTLHVENIHMLINEVERLSAETQESDREIENLKVQLASIDSHSNRANENLAVLVLLMAEVESLRIRLQVSEANSENLRREAFSPSRNRDGAIR